MEKYRSEATLIGTLTYASGYKIIFPVTSTKRSKGVVTFDAVDRNAPSGTRCYGYDMKIRYQGIEGEYRLTVVQIKSLNRNQLQIMKKLILLLFLSLPVAVFGQQHQKEVVSLWG